MDRLSMDSDGEEEADQDELEGEELAAAFPSRYHQSAGVSVGLDVKGACVVGLARAGDRLCAALHSGGLSVHRPDTLVRTEALGGQGGVTGLAGGEASLLYTCSTDQTVRVWDLRVAGGAVTSLRDTTDHSKHRGPPGGDPGRPLSCVAASTDGHTVAAGTEQVGLDTFLLFWDLRQPGRLQGGYWESHGDDVTAVKFHPTAASTLASGSTDGQVNVFDISQPDEDSALVTSHNTEDSVAGLCWYRRKGDGDQLAVVTHTEGLQLWATAAEGPHTVLPRAALCHAVRRSAPQHTYLAGAHGLEGGDGLLVVAGSSCPAGPCLRLALVKNRKAKPWAELDATIGQVPGPARCSLLLPGGHLVTGGEDGVVRLWTEGAAVPTAEGKADKGKIVTGKSKARDKPY
jgi:WD40 repeat protein